MTAVTFAPPRDVLVASSIPGANEALAAGHAARDAAMRADAMTAELARRLARPLPAKGTREHGWAIETRWEDDPFWRCPVHDVPLVYDQQASEDAGQDRWSCTKQGCTEGRWLS